MSRAAQGLHLFQTQTDDIDELFQWQSDSWDFHYQQLTPGKLGFRNQTVFLGDLRLSLYSYDQRILCRDAFTDGDLIVAMVVCADKPARVIGREVGPDTVLVHQRGKEKDYVVEPRTRTLDIAVSAKRFASLGWELSRDLVHDVPPGLVRRCVRIWNQLEFLAQPEIEPASETIIMLEQELLALLRILLSPWMPLTENRPRGAGRQERSFALVKHAQHSMARRSANAKLKIHELADRLGVSERTLYNAFRNWLGIGPYQYDVIRRLHDFRSARRRGSAHPGKVTSAALDAGFMHLGQLGQLYRRHFGETPSETVRRDRSRWLPHRGSGYSHPAAPARY